MRSRLSPGCPACPSSSASGRSGTGGAATRCPEGIAWPRSACGSLATQTAGSSSAPTGTRKSHCSTLKSGYWIESGIAENQLLSGVVRVTGS